MAVFVWVMFIAHILNFILGLGGLYLKQDSSKNLTQVLISLGVSLWAGVLLFGG